MSLEIIIYIESWDRFHIKHLLSMAKRRHSSGVKLSSITIVGLGDSTGEGGIQTQGACGLQSR